MNSVIVVTPEELRKLVSEAVADAVKAAAASSGPSPIMDLEEVTKLLGRTRKTVMLLVAERGLPAHPISEREVRFIRDEVVAWMRAQNFAGAEG